MISRRHFLHAAAALLTAPLLPRASELRGTNYAFLSGDANPFAALPDTRRFSALYTEFWSLDSGSIDVTPGDRVSIKKTGRYADTYEFDVRRTGTIIGVAFTISADDRCIVSPLYQAEESLIIENEGSSQA